MLEEVASFENVIISTGGGAACFYDNMDLMNASGETVYLQASPEGLFAYLKNAKAERPLLAGKSDDEMLAFIRTSLETREPYYLKAKHYSSMWRTVVVKKELVLILFLTLRLLTTKCLRLSTKKGFMFLKNFMF